MNIYLLVSLIVIFILGIMYLLKTNREHFTNFCVPFQKNKPIIWMYWENIPGKKRPNYLDICYDTVLKHCQNDFDVKLLDDTSVYQYLPDLRKDLDTKLKIQQKVDYIRYWLLYTYGGIWIDCDTIVMRDLMPIMDKLQTFDFVGFGCHFNDSSQCANSGKPYPANWVMGSQKHGTLMKRCIKRCDNYLDTVPTKIKYHFFGRETLWSEIKYLYQNDKNWDYYHWTSICLERDSQNRKLVNQRSISKEDIDPECLDKMLFVPIYNSRPGFPKWFTAMSKQQLLQSPMLISKLFRKSLAN